MAKTTKSTKSTKTGKKKTRIFDPDKKEVLLSTDRQRSLDVFRVTSLIPIFPHHVIADIGCGPGFFTVPLAKHVFDGKIYAIDVQQEMLDAAKEGLERIRLTNVELILSKDERLPLDDDSLDGALAAFVMHETEDPKSLLEDTRQCLRRGGWIALLEWHKREMEEGPPLEDRIDEPDLYEMAYETGFRSLGRYTLNDNQYILVMRK